MEVSTSITEAPTEPPMEAVLVFDSAMPGMLPKAVWHSKVRIFGVRKLWNFLKIEDEVKIYVR